MLLGGEVLADSRRARVLYEAALPPRWYLPAADVDTSRLVPSGNLTRCAYKGVAHYWHVAWRRLVEDLVWSYPDPEHDAEPVRDMLCFFSEKVDIELDGVVVDRPTTQWSPSDASGAEALAWADGAAGRLGPAGLTSTAAGWGGEGAARAGESVAVSLQYGPVGDRLDRKRRLADAFCPLVLAGGAHWTEFVARAGLPTSPPSRSSAP